MGRPGDHVVSSGSNGSIRLSGFRLVSAVAITTSVFATWMAYIRHPSVSADSIMGVPVLCPKEDSLSSLSFIVAS